MGRGCSVCARPDVATIDGDLDALSLDEVAKKYSPLKRSSLDRHKKHLVPTGAQALDYRALAINAHMSGAEMSLKLVELAERVVAHELTLGTFGKGPQAVAELRKALELHAKVTGQLAQLPDQLHLHQGVPAPIIERLRDGIEQLREERSRAVELIKARNGFTPERTPELEEAPHGA